jgi:hypothetical protein
MVAGLRALLAGVIDYAGLFPPASLPLEQAFANYIRYRQSSDSWMLGRFVCPAARLPELRPLVAALDPKTGLIPLTVLGQGGKALRDFVAVVCGDLKQMLTFRQECGGHASIEVLDLRLPNEFAEPERMKDLRSLLPGPRAVLRKEGLSLEATFFEIDSGSDWRDRLDLLVRTLNEANGQLGFKLRCGGQTAAAFPSAEDVAFAITACRESQVPLKFTAGLHHPHRHFDASVQTTMHGFLNVFGAAVLAHAHCFDRNQLQTILLDEQPSNFHFSEDGFQWRDQHATVVQIEAARRYVVSFGSCSFDEPVADLHRLGLL